MKKIYILLIACTIAICTKGQYYGGGQQVAMNAAMRAGNNTPTVYEFNVRYKNGNEIKIKSAMNYDNKKKTYYLKQKKEIVYPKETTEIYIANKEKDTLRGLAADSMWLFKTLNTKITCYSVMPNRSKSSLVYFRNPQNSKLLRIHPESKEERLKTENILKEITKGNKNAEAVFAKYEKRKKIKHSWWYYVIFPFGGYIHAIITPAKVRYLEVIEAYDYN